MKKYDKFYWLIEIIIPSFFTNNKVSYRLTSQPMFSPNRSPLAISQYFQQNQRRTSFDKIQIPSENQILSMFEKNGFRSNNIVTRDQLKELFDRQYVTNNLH